MSNQNTKCRAEASRLASIKVATTGLTISFQDGKKKLGFPRGWQQAHADTCITTLFEKQHTGLALVTGDGSDVLAVDLDVAKQKDVDRNIADGMLLWSDLLNKHGELPACTPIQETGSGGRHILFSLSGSLSAVSAKSRAKIMVNGQDCSIDVRGDGGCIIISPTTYMVDQERKAYKWLKPLTSKQDLLACPSWLIDILNDHSKQTGKEMVPLRKKPRLDVTSVNCHHLLRQVEEIMTCSIGKTWKRINGFDFAPVDRSIGCPICSCGEPHMSNNWCMRCVVGDIFTISNYSTSCSIKVYGWETHPIIQKLLAHPNVDDPYVDLLVAREQSLGRGLSHDGRSFYEFDGICWAQVEDIAVMQSVRVLGYEIMAKLVFVLKKSLPANNKPTNDDERKLADQVKQFKIARGYVQKAGNVRSITDSAKQLLYDREFAAKLDTNPDLLACQNGVLDLTTGELREGRPDDNLSKKIAVDYKGLDLDTPDIDRFMWSVFEDKEVVSYLQMLLGYAITGHMREELWVIMYGSGSNGKSILNNLIKGVMGDSHVTMDKACLIKSARPAGKTILHPTLQPSMGRGLLSATKSQRMQPLTMTLSSEQPHRPC